MMGQKETASARVSIGGTMHAPATKRRDGRRRAGLIMLVLTVLAGSLAVVAGSASAQGPGPTAAGSSAVTRLPTPIFSSRRLPGLLRSRITDAPVADVVRSATKEQPPTSCLVVTDHGRVIHTLNGELPLIPASLAKLLTGAAALHILGPETRLTTTVKGPAVVPGGIVDGDVYLIGGGDPLLYTQGFQQTREYRDQPFNDFNQLADRIKAAGVTQINGNIVGDDTRYDAIRGVPTWAPNYQKDEQVGALSALQVNWGETGLERDPNRTSPNRRLGDPPHMAAVTLETLLEQRGVKVNGIAVSGIAPQSAPLTELAALESLTIRDLVSELNSFSDNNTAELLTKEMGLKVSGRGTTEAGVAAITGFGKELGLPMDGVSYSDGSGLDRNDRVTCNMVATLLDTLGPDSDLARSMAVLGQRGTLQKRKTPFIDGKVTAKTGTLKEVIALAGYERTDGGSILTFVSIQNGASMPGTKVQDDLLVGLLSYPQGPPIDQIGPR